MDACHRREVHFGWVRRWDAGQASTDEDVDDHGPTSREGCAACVVELGIGLRACLGQLEAGARWCGDIVPCAFLRFQTNLLSMQPYVSLLPHVYIQHVHVRVLFCSRACLSCNRAGFLHIGLCRTVCVHVAIWLRSSDLCEQSHREKGAPRLFQRSRDNQHIGSCSHD